MSAHRKRPSLRDRIRAWLRRHDPHGRFMADFRQRENDLARRDGRPLPYPEDDGGQQ